MLTREKKKNLFLISNFYLILLLWIPVVFFHRSLNINQIFIAAATSVLISLLFPFSTDRETRKVQFRFHTPLIGCETVSTLQKLKMMLLWKLLVLQSLMGCFAGKASY